MAKSAHNLQKNESFNLTKDSDFLKKVRIEMSWQTPDNVFPAYDADISAFCLGSNQKLISDEGFIFYNQLSTPDGSIVKSADELTGGVESIDINIETLSPAISEISLIVTLHKAKARKQSLDKVRNAKLDIFNIDSDELIATFALDAADPGATALQVGSFYQTEEGFIFQAINKSYVLELQDFVDGYSE